ncbi:hypothetical protein OUZ56_005802 [Daphnia magna]|uniref:Phasin domain-containing protein n=1 Tax=Daphnia magna TaxID=35525 RepID=A0ABQ9YTV5_9CRUS|nr:hypothetical protein OUZ56_005802 [Daphnia magna]
MNSISKNSPETALNTNPNNFNARKFGKYATQCGLSSMECPWPADVGVLSTMSSKMTQGLDRAGYTALFNHMAQQTAIEVLGLKNMVAQARAIYGKWGQVVDNLMADYDNWLTTNNTVTALAATIPATHAASIQLVRGLTFD